MRSVRVLLAAAAAVVVASEVAHARASRGAPRADPGRPLAVVVLGYRSRPGGRPHPLQRWRVAIAVRTLRRHQDGVLVLSGAARGGPSEAQVMARLAAAAGVPRSRLVLEEEATTTWENVARTAPLVEAYPQVAFASAPLHAARARAYLAANAGTSLVVWSAGVLHRSSEGSGWASAAVGRRHRRCSAHCGGGSAPDRRSERRGRRCSAVGRRRCFGPSGAALRAGAWRGRVAARQPPSPRGPPRAAELLATWDQRQWKGKLCRGGTYALPL